MIFSVIVPVYNDWFRLQKCMNALQAQTFSSVNFEIIVVNNGPKQDIPRNFLLSENAFLLHEPKAGSYNARNRGANAASGTYIAFTDSDCIPDSDWLQQAELILEKTDADMIGGRIDIFRVNRHNFSYIYDKYTAFRQDKNVPEGNSVTANLIVKKSMFDDVSGFREDLKSGGDWEFTSRCIAEGYLMEYGDTATVYHPANESFWEILKKQRRLTCWGSIRAQEKFGYSPMRIMASHVATGPNNKSKTINLLKDRFVVYSFDLFIYFYRTFIHVLIVLKIINPHSVRS